MKHKFLSLAVGAAIALPGAVMAEAMKVYGRMDMSIDYVDVDLDTGSNDSDSNWEVNSNASRFGVKGDLALSDVLTAVYLIEWEVDGSGDDSNNRLKERNRYVGLRSDYGYLLLGKNDSPLKKSQGKFELFDNHAADVKHLLEGENRLDNSITYISPKIADSIIVKIALIPDEDNKASGDAGDSDGVSTSISYKNDSLYAAVAYDSKVDNRNTVRLSVVYNASDQLQLGGIYQVSDLDNFNSLDFVPPEGDETGFMLNAGYTVGSNLYKIQVGQSTTEFDVSTLEDADITMVALGVDHKFSKQTKVYAEAVFFDETDKDGDADEDPSDSTWSFGVQHRF